MNSREKTDLLECSNLGDFELSTNARLRFQTRTPLEAREWELKISKAVDDLGRGPLPNGLRVTPWPGNGAEKGTCETVQRIFGWEEEHLKRGTGKRLMQHVDGSLPRVTPADAERGERLMSEMLFGGGWAIEEARIIEEEVFFNCIHRFRRMNMVIYPGMYAEHIKRWRFVFPRSSVLITAQEDLLDHPDEIMESVFNHVGVYPIKITESKSRRGHDFSPRGGESTEDQWKERCANSAVDPRLLLKAYEHGFPDWYSQIGKNWSWESTAVSAHGEEGPQCVESEQERRQRERAQGRR